MNTLLSNSKSYPITPPNIKIYAIHLALKEVKDPLNLFSVSVYAVNFLPWLSRSFIKLDVNPLSPSTHTSLHLPTGKRLPHLYSVCLISQASASSHICGKHTEQTALTGTFRASTEQADQFHSYTHTNLKGLHACFSHISLNFKG